MINHLIKEGMKKLIELMSEFGATFLPKNKYTFPLRIISSSMPIGINYKSGVSAQLKSAVIFAGLNSYGNTEIIEVERSRDHTENMLIKNKQAIKIIDNKKKLLSNWKKLFKSYWFKCTWRSLLCSFFCCTDFT